MISIIKSLLYQHDVIFYENAFPYVARTKYSTVSWIVQPPREVMEHGPTVVVSPKLQAMQQD